MKIKKVIIENFRNYIGKHEFILDKRITILHGDNGYGKSTFFDAIEWCLTNSISRFSKNETDGSKLESFKNDIVTQYVDTENINCRVSIELEEFVLTREFSFNNGEFGNTQAKITDLNNKILLDDDSNEINTLQRVENFLKSGLNSTVSLSKTSIGQLFKQTYILSQEQVTEFISSDNPEKRFRSLANIMGFQPMLNLADNTRKIIKELDKKHKETEDDIELINNSIKSKEETMFNVDVFDLNTMLSGFKLSSNSESISDELNNIFTDLIEKKLKLEKQIELYKKINSEYSTLYELEMEIKTKNDEFIDTKSRRKTVEKLLEKIINKCDELKSQQVNNEELSSLKLKLEHNEQAINDLGFENDYDKLTLTIDRYRNRISQLEYFLTIYKNIQTIEKERKELPLNIVILRSKLKRSQRKISRNEVIINSISEKLLNRTDNIIGKLLNSVNNVYEHLKIHDNNGHCPVCLSFVGTGLVDSVKINLENLSEKMNDEARYADRLLTLKKDLELRNKDLTFSISNMEREIKNNKKKLQENETQLKKIEANQYYNKEVLSLSLTAINDYLFKNREKLSLLEQALDYVLNYRNLTGKYKNLGKVSKTKLTLAEITKSLSNFERAKSRLEIYIDNLEQKTVSLETRINILDKNIEQVKLNLEEKYHNTKFSEIIRIFEFDLATVKQQTGQVSKAKDILKNITSNELINNQIKSLTIQKAELISKIKRLKSAIDSLENFVMDIKSIFGGEAEEYLNKPTSTIQKYYRYLDPLPTTNFLKFVSKEEKLWIKVAFENSVLEKEQLATARNILSSGQLNVLAISIFLAVNEAQNVHPLDFVGIDDPIQNMDDVNQFSICDILGGIKKQLIFSTHDLDFLKLFIKKNDHNKHDIQVISLKSPYLDNSKVEYISLT